MKTALFLLVLTATANAQHVYDFGIDELTGRPGEVGEVIFDTLRAELTIVEWYDPHALTGGLQRGSFHLEPGQTIRLEPRSQRISDQYYGELLQLRYGATTPVEFFGGPSVPMEVGVTLDDWIGQDNFERMSVGFRYPGSTSILSNSSMSWYVPEPSTIGAMIWAAIILLSACRVR